jgi:hypothetical protein
VNSKSKSRRAGPGMVFKACNPSYAGEVGRRITVPGCPGKWQTLSSKTGLEEWLMQEALSTAKK